MLIALSTSILGVWVCFMLSIITAQIIAGYGLSDKSQVLPHLARYPLWRIAQRLAVPLTVLAALAWITEAVLLVMGGS